MTLVIFNLFCYFTDRAPSHMGHGKCLTTPEITIVKEMIKIEVHYFRKRSHHTPKCKINLHQPPSKKCV